jgi:hypothetical protein
MAIVHDVPGALALLLRTSHARLPKGAKIFTSIIVGNPTEPLAARRKDRRSLDDAVRWL